MFIRVYPPDSLSRYVRAKLSGSGSGGKLKRQIFYPIRPVNNTIGEISNQDLADLGSENYLE